MAALDERIPVEDRGWWRAVENVTTITGRRKRDPVLTLRRVFVHSSARAGAAAAARAKKLDRARDDLELAGWDRATIPMPTQSRRESPRSPERRVGSYLRTEVGADPETGKPTLPWSFNEQSLAAEAATDGWYAFVTAGEVLRRYKGQEAVERRYGAFKGPLAVAPMFLHDNRRIAALITVICLALLVFCLVERALRKAIAPATTLDQLQSGRPATPTGKLIFHALWPGCD